MRSLVNLFAVLFFFQAEDGIRDSSVTGVQTCALPIYMPSLCRRLIALRTSTVVPHQTTTRVVSRHRLRILWLKRSEEHTSELQSHLNLVCRLLLEKKKKIQTAHQRPLVRRWTSCPDTI